MRCEYCSHGVHLYNDTVLQCNLYGGIVKSTNPLYINRYLSSHCDFFNKDTSKDNICLNCIHFAGGNDFGLSCNKDYYTICDGITDACIDFERKPDIGAD